MPRVISASKSPRPSTKRFPAPSVEAVLKSLEQLGSQSVREQMGPRYGIHTERAFGVTMAKMQQLAKRLGPNHSLAQGLWATGWYEARMLAALIDEPDQVTPAQMERWCRDCDNWAIVDTVCFKLFDRVPHAWNKVATWAVRRDEFVKRSAFALLASLALHEHSAEDGAFMRCLPLLEHAAADERNFVKKAVSWALRAVGRRNLKLNAAAVELARQLADSPLPASRWVGKEALRELRSAPVQKRLGQRSPRKN